MDYEDAYISLYKMLKKNSQTAEELSRIKKEAGDTKTSASFTTMHNAYEHVLHTMAVLTPGVENK